MSANDDILTLLEAELELERELGVRVVEIDRSLLTDEASVAKISSAAKIAKIENRENRENFSARENREEASAAKFATEKFAKKEIARNPSREIRENFATDDSCVTVAFLLDEPLKPAAEEIFAKATNALKAFKPNATFAKFCAPPAAAKAAVVLGSKAFKKWFPEKRNALPGFIFRDECNRPVLVSYSLNQFLCYSPDSPELKSRKQDMWTRLKDFVVRRIENDK